MMEMNGFLFIGIVAVVMMGLGTIGVKIGEYLENKELRLAGLATG